jgi:hypothetical protein
MTTEQFLRPESSISQHHWWRMFSDIRSALCRLDKRDADRGTLNTLIDEYGYQANASTLVVPPQTNNPVMITGLIIGSTAGTATVTIEDRQIPVPMGTTVLTNLQIIRREARPSSLATGVPGTLYLEVMGNEFPRIVD